MATAIPLSLHRENSSSEAWSLRSMSCWLLMVLITFINGADFRGTTGAENFEVHWQIYLRLLVSISSGAMAGLLLFPKSYRDFIAWPGFSVTLILVWYGVCVPFGIERVYCAAAWVCLTCVLVFVPTAMRVLGAWGIVSSIAVGLVLYVAGSWIAYIYYPEVGIYKEQITNTYALERMGGLGHPNELGFYCAFTILTFVAIGISKRLPWVVVVPVLLVAGLALLKCYSRTSMIVTTIGLIFTLQNQLRANIAIPIAGLFLGFVVAFAAVSSGKVDWIVEDLLSGVSKSGSSSELSSATGRDEIWKYGIEQIKASPVFGYGYGAARFIMYNHSYHCHNVVLNAMMAGGVVAGVLLLLQMFYVLWGMFFQPRYEIDGLAVCFLIGGMVEGLLSATTPAAHMAIWSMILFWRPFKFALADTPVGNQKISERVTAES